MLEYYKFTFIVILILFLTMYRGYHFALYERYIEYGENFKKLSFLEFTSHHLSIRHVIYIPILNFRKHKVNKRLLLKINVSTFIIYFCIILIYYISKRM